MTFYIEESTRGRYATVTGPLAPAEIRDLHRADLSGLLLNYALGFAEPDLRFLDGLSLIHLHVRARWITDVDVVYTMADTLTSLNIAIEASVGVELERLPRITNLSVEAWGQIAGSVRFASQLTSLYAGSYGHADLEPLSGLPLARLLLKDRPALRSLAGLEQLASLESLGVVGGRYLMDINALRGSTPLLRELSLESCRAITEIDAIASCTSLAMLNIGDLGEIATVAPVRLLRDLETLYMYESTKVIDGNLGPIADLPNLKDFRSMNRPAYRPKVKEIQAQIAKR